MITYKLYKDQEATIEIEEKRTYQIRQEVRHSCLLSLLIFMEYAILEIHHKKREIEWQNITVYAFR